MRKLTLSSSLVVSCFLLSGSGLCAQGPSPSAGQYAAESFVIDRSDWLYSNNADGTGYREHTVAVTMKVEAKETVRTPLGTYQTVRVQPSADAGVVKARGNIWIWYTDDDRHIPVQMRARLFWGTITFRLTALDQK